MKRLNVKFVLLMLVGGTLFCGTAWGLHRFQVSRNADSLTQRAVKARADGDYEESIRLLRRYVQYRPKDLEGWGQLATDHLSLVTETLDYDRRDLGVTYAVVEDVLRRDPDNHSLRRKAVDFFMMIQRHSDVIDHINILHEDPELAKDSELAVKLALCHVRLNSPEKSLELLESLIGFDSDSGTFDMGLATAPDAIEAYHLLAAIKRQNGDLDLLDKIYDQSVEANPDNAKAWLERCRHRRANLTDDDGSGLELARQDIAEALRLSPDDENVLLMAADTAMVAGDFAAAKHYLDVGLEKHPNSTNIFVTRSDLARREEGLQPALDWIAKGLEANSDNALLVVKRAELELASRDAPAAKASIAQLHRTSARRNWMWIDYLEVRLMMMEQKWLMAAEKLTNVRATLIDQNPHLRPQVLTSLMQCYEQLEKWDVVIQVANEVGNDSSARFTALLAKATAYHRTRRYEQAFQSYDLILEIYEKSKKRIDPTILFSYYTMLIEQQQRLPDEKKSWSRTVDILKRIVKDEELPRVRKEAAKAQYLAARKGMKAAEDYLGDLADKTDDAAIDELYDRLKPSQPNDAALPGEPDLSTLQGRVQKLNQLLRRDKQNAAASMAQLEQGIDDWNSRQKKALWGALAQGYLMVPEYDEVFRLWKQIGESDRNDLKIRRKFFDLAFERSNEERMNEGLEMIADLVGTESSEWMLAEAMRMTWEVTQGKQGREHLERVDRLLRDISETRSGWPSLLRVRAMVAKMQGDDDNAVEYLEQALSAGQNDISIVQQLASIYIKLNRKEDALRVLDTLDAGQRSDHVQRQILTLQDEKVEQAKIDAVVPAETENASDLAWRGHILAKHGHLKPAHQSLKRLTELHPQLPQAWIALVDFLLNARQRDAANKTMRLAQTNLPEQVMHVTMARCYLMAASRGAPNPKERGLAIRQAEEFYRQALQGNPEEPQLLQDIATFYMSIGQENEASTHLHQLLDGSETHQIQTPPRIAWARRSKARILASSGSYQDYLQAIDIIRQNVPKGEQLGSADLKVLAEITLPRPDSLSHKQIIKELEGLQKDRSLTIVENTFLSRLYQRVNRFNDAEGILFKLAASNPNNQQIVSLLIETLLKQDKYDSAEQWLRKLPQNSLNRFRIHALMLARRGQPEQAAKELLGLIPKTKLAPEQHDLLRNIATLLEEIEQYEPAEALWRQYVKLEPQHQLRLAAFLGRCDGLDKLQQAFELCDAALKDGGSRIEAIAQIGVASLRDHMQELDEEGDKSEYLDIVARWFRQGIERAPESKSLRLQQAEFETLRGKTDQVVEIYREFLKREDLDDQQRALVQNNLAYVLALVERGKEALGLVEDAITFLGPTPHLLDTRAMAKIAMGDFTDAEHDLTNALDEGNSASLRFHLAYANYMDRNLGGAEQEMRAAMELGLDPHIMHPVERKIYNKIVTDLNLQAVAMK